MKRYLILILAVLLVGTVAQAQATRTWVSGVGDDVNPCSRTAPCKTYAGAISKTAAGGIISTLDPGGFGAVTITKSITIDGSDQIGGVLAAGTNGVVVNAAAADVVTLRSLEIHGVNTGFDGVRALNFAELNIENCRIQNFTNDGVKILPSAAGTFKVNIRNSDIRNNLRGVESFPTGAAAVKLTIAESSFSGHQLGSGIDIVQLTDANVTNSQMQHNATGFQVQSAAATASISGSLIANNATGISAGGEVRLNFTTVAGNTTNGMTGTTRCFQSNMIIGNAGNQTCTFSVAPQ